MVNSLTHPTETLAKSNQRRSVEESLRALFGPSEKPPAIVRRFLDPPPLSGLPPLYLAGEGSVSL